MAPEAAGSIPVIRPTFSSLLASARRRAHSLGPLVKPALRAIRTTVDAAVRRLPLSRKPTLLHGRLVWFAPGTWASIHGRYEPYMARALRTALKRGDTFIDVGAHHGIWSVYAASLVGPRGKVVALEPSEAYRTLTENVRGHRHVAAIRCGASDREGHEVFFGQGDATSGSFIREVTAINEQHSRARVTGATVAISTLDTLVAEHALTPSVVKLDVEGFELRVLSGATAVLAAKPRWVIEIHPPQLALSGGSEGAIFDLLHAHGYQTTIIDRNPNSLYTIVATPAR